MGFRFTVQRYARHLGLTGWVKNVSGGSVEILADGPQDQLEHLMQDIEEYFHGYITNKRHEFQPTTGVFSGFKIEY